MAEREALKVVSEHLIQKPADARAFTILTHSTDSSDKIENLACQTMARPVQDPV